ISLTNVNDEPFYLTIVTNGNAFLPQGSFSGDYLRLEGDIHVTVEGGLYFGENEVIIEPVPIPLPLAALAATPVGELPESFKGTKVLGRASLTIEESSNSFLRGGLYVDADSTAFLGVGTRLYTYNSDPVLWSGAEGCGNVYFDGELMLQYTTQQITPLEDLSLETATSITVMSGENVADIRIQGLPEPLEGTDTPSYQTSPEGTNRLSLTASCFDVTGHSVTPDLTWSVTTEDELEQYITINEKGELSIDPALPRMTTVSITVQVRDATESVNAEGKVYTGKYSEAAELTVLPASRIQPFLRLKDDTALVVPTGDLSATKTYSGELINEWGVSVPEAAVTIAFKEKTAAAEDSLAVQVAEDNLSAQVTATTGCGPDAQVVFTLSYDDSQGMSLSQDVTVPVFSDPFLRLKDDTPLAIPDMDSSATKTYSGELIELGVSVPEAAVTIALKEKTAAAEDSLVVQVAEDGLSAQVTATTGCGENAQVVFTLSYEGDPDVRLSRDVTVPISVGSDRAVRIESGLSEGLLLLQGAGSEPFQPVTHTRLGNTLEEEYSLAVSPENSGVTLIKKDEGYVVQAGGETPTGVYTLWITGSDSGLTCAPVSLQVLPQTEKPILTLAVDENLLRREYGQPLPDKEAILNALSLIPSFSGGPGLNALIEDLYLSHSFPQEEGRDILSILLLDEEYTFVLEEPEGAFSLEPGTGCVELWGYLRYELVPLRFQEESLPGLRFYADDARNESLGALRSAVEEAYPTVLLEDAYGNTFEAETRWFPASGSFTPKRGVYTFEMYPNMDAASFAHYTFDGEAMELMVTVDPAKGVYTMSADAITVNRTVWDGLSGYDALGLPTAVPVTLEHGGACSVEITGWSPAFSADLFGEENEATLTAILDPPAWLTITGGEPVTVRLELVPDEIKVAGVDILGDTDFTYGDTASFDY
ncbi:MAG: hypothetical protein Q4C22_00910, partial [Bacillota bacterium]|nr:hypothetical protein [Bacillota bacterium]